MATSTTTPMRVNSIPWWLWIIPIVLLFVAAERMPYGYYMLTRIVVCGFAAFLAFVAWKESLSSRVWSAAVLLYCWTV